MVNVELNLYDDSMVSACQSCYIPEVIIHVSRNPGCDLKLGHVEFLSESAHKSQVSH